MSSRRILVCLLVGALLLAVPAGAYAGPAAAVAAHPSASWVAATLARVNAFLASLLPGTPAVHSRAGGGAATLQCSGTIRNGQCVSDVCYGGIMDPNGICSTQ